MGERKPDTIENNITVLSSLRRVVAYPVAAQFIAPGTQSIQQVHNVAAQFIAPVTQSIEEVHPVAAQFIAPEVQAKKSRRNKLRVYKCFWHA